MKLTPDELQSKIDQLKKQKKSGKRKSEASSREEPSTRVKVQKLGDSPSPMLIKDGQALSAQSPSSLSLQGAQSGSRSSPELPLSSPTPSEVEVALGLVSRIQSSPLPPEPKERLLQTSSRSYEFLKKEGLGGGEDSFFDNAELAAGAISSILPESDVQRAASLPPEASFCSALQGAATVSIFHLSSWFSAVASY